MITNIPWCIPVTRFLVPTSDSNSFDSFGLGETGLPLFPHVGAFAVPRKHHVHEGVDIYVPDGTQVFAVEEGTVIDVQPFTGAHADSGWWEDTWAYLVRGNSGIVVYGEVYSNDDVKVGHKLDRGDYISDVKRVLRNDKGRPTSMLHIELHDRSLTGTVPSWEGREPPVTLRDPTPYLMEAVRWQSRW